MKKYNLKAGCPVLLLCGALFMIASPSALAVAPGTPTNLAATAGDGEIVLNWTAPPDDGQGAIEAYNVYRCEGTGCVIDADIDWLAWVTIGTTYTDVGTRDKPFVAGTTHRYAVAAYRNEEGNWSNEVEAVAQGEPPPLPEEPETSLAAPSGLTVTSANATSVSLSWRAPADGILGYNVYRCGLQAGETTCELEWHAWVANEGDAPPAPTSYTDTGGETGGVTAGATYLYAVAASYPPDYANGQWSEIVTAVMATTPGGPSLTAGSITATTATLTLGGHTGNWRYKQTAPATNAACSGAQTGASVNLTSLTAATAYTYKAYSDSSCTTELASVTFDTLAVTLTAGSLSTTGATLTLANHSGNWHYKETAPSTTATCSGAQTGAAVNLTGLTEGASYTYKAYSDSSCSTELASVTFDTLAITLTVGSLSATGATLTLANHGGNWHYKETAPTAGSCSAAQTGAGVNLTGLTEGTSYTYKAYSDSACATDLASVTFTTPEFEASFESGHHWFQRDVIPALSGNTTWHSIAWKGERIQQHILVSNVPSNSRISLVASDLTSVANDTIPAATVSFRYPRFVAGHTEVRSCGKDYQQDNQTAYLSDALFSEPVQTLPASWPELVWMSVDIPSDTPAGDYSGTVTVTAVPGETSTAMITLQVSIEVVSWTMPAAADRQFHLDLWQFPVSVLDRYNDANPEDPIEIWSEDHYALLEPTYRYLADLGQRTVTTYIKEDALGAPSMIRWTLKRGGTWEYDYSVFDTYVSRLASWGLDEQISAFSPVGWNWGDAPYWDETTQSKKTFSADVGSSAWNARWQHFLTDFRAHLLEKEWLDRTVLYLDESSEEDVQAVIDLVETIDESWKIGWAYIGQGHDGPGEKVLNRVYDSSGSMALVGTTYVDTGLTTGETYRYAVDACSAGCSTPSAPVTVLAQTPAVPGAPTGLTAVGATEVTLNWMAPATTGSSALTGYNVYRCEGDASCAPAWLGWVVSGTTYTDSNVTADTTYRYRVAACNGTGCGNRSGETTVVTGDTVNQQSAGNPSGGTTASEVQRDQSVPSVPTGLAAFATSVNAIQLNWEGNATNGYDVYRCIGSETCTPEAYLGWTYADNQVAHPDRISTYYTSCVQPRPNSFVAAAGDPADVAALPWHALQRRQDGYLRWAFDNWRSSDPLDLREGAFTAGDFSLVYRSSNDRGMTVVPSIRSELLYDGIEDFEKVQVLRSSLSACGENSLAGRWLGRLERTVDTFSAAPLMAGRAGDLIGEAHDRLGEVSLQLAPDVCQNN